MTEEEYLAENPNQRQNWGMLRPETKELLLREVAGEQDLWPVVRMMVERDVTLYAHRMMWQAQAKVEHSHTRSIVRDWLFAFAAIMIFAVLVGLLLRVLLVQ
jgi:hypothetical protein